VKSEIAELSNLILGYLLVDLERFCWTRAYGDEKNDDEFLDRNSGEFTNVSALFRSPGVHTQFGR
jgi:hypothetical protein